jgi:hypothetical protein
MAAEHPVKQAELVATEFEVMAIDGRARKLLSGPPQEAQDDQESPNSAIRD